MIKTRLIALAEKAQKYIFLNILAQWLGLLANAVIVFAVALFVQRILDGDADGNGLAATLAVICAAAIVRVLCGVFANKTSFLASSGVKRILRQKIYDKLLRLGPSYTEQIGTAEVLQVATEGVDQLEIYFGKYLPQFFYSFLAPLTLFVLLAPVHLRTAGLLLACVPLIPIVIMAVMMIAKKILSKYWKSYTSLGEVFLDNLQGMTTLKVFSADEARQTDMRRHAEDFRRATMNMLKMQLNSIIVMDFVAFGGAALGVILSTGAYLRGDIALWAALVIVLISAEFYVPMRLLGSYFHIAMNGMTACDRMFEILDLPEPADGTKPLPGRPANITLRDVRFAYEPERPVLQSVSLTVEPGQMVSVVGESGCGKSTVAALLSGRRQGYEGSILIGEVELRDARREDLQNYATLVPHDGYVFAGTVAEHLRMAKAEATEREMNDALKQVRLYDFFAAQNGLATQITERGANLSGGQRQRLCIARALLRDSALYIFDEATSNIDTESEAVIMGAVHMLAQSGKCVLLISHRLANVVPSAAIAVLDGGAVAELGTHDALIEKRGVYAARYQEQRALEQYAQEAI